MDIKPNHAGNSVNAGQSLTDRKASLRDSSVHNSTDPINENATTDTRVELNTQDMNEIRRSMTSIAPFNRDLVEALRQSIQDKTYSMDLYNITNKLTDSI